MGPVRLPQQFEKQVEAALGHQRVALEAEGPDACIVAVYVMAMAFMIMVSMRMTPMIVVCVVMGLVVAMGVMHGLLRKGLGIEPAAHVGNFRPGIEEA